MAAILPPVSEFRTDDSASGFNESGGSKFVMRKVLRIKRVAPVESETEQPLVTSKGYKMADPGGPDRPRPSHAIFHRTLEMAENGPIFGAASPRVGHYLAVC